MATNVINKDYILIRTDENVVMFNEESALAMLLINSVLTHNSNWHKFEWPDEFRETHIFYIDCSGTFSILKSDDDCDPLHPYDIQELYEMWYIDKEFGPAVFVAKKRKKMPNDFVCKKIRRRGIWDIDNMGLQEWQ